MIYGFHISDDFKENGITVSIVSDAERREKLHKKVYGIRAKTGLPPGQATYSHRPYR